MHEKNILMPLFYKKYTVHSKNSGTPFFSVLEATWFSLYGIITMVRQLLSKFRDSIVFFKTKKKKFRRLEKNLQKFI